MKLLPTRLEGVLLIEPQVHHDERGFFLESWSQRRFADAGLDIEFVQDNHSRSNRGVLRGIHYQLNRPQGKLVRVSSGRVFDVAVDLRRSSNTFGGWFGTELSGTNKRMLWIPPGFGHGFLALEDDTDLTYKCSDVYVPEDERCIAWDDTSLAINWPMVGAKPILSMRDAAGLLLSQSSVFP